MLDEYGQRDFDWSKRYFDYEVFDSDGNQLLKNEDEATAENLQANSEEDRRLCISGVFHIFTGGRTVIRPD